MKFLSCFLSNRSSRRLQCLTFIVRLSRCCRKEIADASYISNRCCGSCQIWPCGCPHGMATVAAVLWRGYLKHSPLNPQWWDRDRFVLSNGHGSMLLYALLL